MPIAMRTLHAAFACSLHSPFRFHDHLGTQPREAVEQIITPVQQKRGWSWDKRDLERFFSFGKLEK